jgi:hypothetical protein
LDTTNKYLVAANGKGIVIMNPPRGPIPADDALTLAAWIVAMAEHMASLEFNDVRRAVENT